MRFFFQSLALLSTSLALHAGLGNDETWHQGSFGAAPSTPKETCLNCDDDGGGSGSWTAVQDCGCSAGKPNGTFTEQFPSESACKSALASSGLCGMACCSCRCTQGGGGGGAARGSGGPKADTGGIKAGVDQAKQAVNALIHQPQDNGADLLAEDAEQRSARYGVGKVDLGAQGLGDGKLEAQLMKLQPWCQRRFKAKPSAKDRAQAGQAAAALASLIQDSRSLLERSEPSFNQRQRARARFECAESVLGRLREQAQAPAAAPTPAPEDDLAPYRKVAKHWNFGPEEWKRVEDAIDAFEGVRAPGPVAATRQAIDGRSAAMARQLDAAAAAAAGPELFAVAAGRQGGHDDCMLWALANASGTPYGVVTAKAGELYREGAFEGRSDLAGVIKSGGVSVGEAMLLTESMGQLHTVAPADFDRALAQGKPVMIGIAPAHQVVLSKSFEHGGQRWYQFIDSGKGPLRRSYATAQELKAISLGSGYVYSPDDNKVAPMLRKAAR